MSITPTPPFLHNQEGDMFTHTLIDSDGNERPYMNVNMWTALKGGVYLPPSTIPPIGLTSDGLPVSFAVFGPYGSDYTTIAYASGAYC